MSNLLSLFLLLSTVALTTTTTNLRRLSAVDHHPPFTAHQLPLPTLPIPPPHSPQSPPPPLPQSPQSPPPYQFHHHIQQQQLKNIIDALIDAGDYTAWANILFNANTNTNSSTTAALIPTTATMFVPRNDALTHLTATATGAYNFDPFIIPYHILPQRLTFSELQLFKTRTRFPTLLPSKTIIITSNTPANFTIDDALIVQPDVYLTPAVCVHGIGALLDYTIYGDHDADSTTPASGFLPPTTGGESESSPELRHVRNSCGTVCVVERIEIVVVLLLLAIVWTLILLIICLHFGLNFS